MKSFLITSLLLLCFFVSIDFVHGQRSPGHHLILTDDGVHNDCSSPLVHGDSVKVKITKTDYISPTGACPEMRVLIREQVTGEIIGISSPSDNWTWSLINEGFLCDYDGDKFDYLKTTIYIHLDLNTLCEYLTQGEQSVTYNIRVDYELVEANVNGNGEYELYNVNNSECFDYYFPPNCFHSHSEEAAVVSNIGYCIDCGLSEGEIGSFLQGINQESDSRLTTKQNSESMLSENSTRIYPNPFENAFSLDYQSKDFSDLSVTLYTVEGKQVFQKVYRAANTTGTITVPTNTLAPGIYVCKFWDGETYQTFKLSKL